MTFYSRVNKCLWLFFKKKKKKKTFKNHKHNLLIFTNKFIFIIQLFIIYYLLFNI